MFINNDVTMHVNYDNNLCRYFKLLLLVQIFWHRFYNELIKNHYSTVYIITALVKNLKKIFLKFINLNIYVFLRLKTMHFDKLVCFETWIHQLLFCGN